MTIEPMCLFVCFFAFFFFLFFRCVYKRNIHITKKAFFFFDNVKQGFF